MSLFLHCHAPHHSMATLSPFSTFNSKPLCASLPNPSFLTHQQQQQHPYPLTTTTTSDHKPLSVSTLPRKLLCKPPKGKYVREDYLVVCHFKLLQFLFLFLFLSQCFWVCVVFPNYINHPPTLFFSFLFTTPVHEYTSICHFPLSKGKIMLKIVEHN